MVDELLEERARGRARPSALSGHSKTSAPLFFDPAICRLGSRMVRKLGTSAALPVEHADSGRAAHDAKRLRHTKRE